MRRNGLKAANDLPQHFAIAIKAEPSHSDMANENLASVGGVMVIDYCLSSIDY